MRHGRLSMWLALAALACGGDGGSGPDNELTLSLGTPSGDLQAGAPLQALGPFRVRALLGNTPASGQTVNWSIITGQGTLSVPTSITDAQGIATVNLTLGLTAGFVQVRATLTGAAGSPRTFTAAAVVPGQFALVEVINNQFSPGNVTVSAGGTVGWAWAAGAGPHNINPVGGAARPSQPTLRDGPFIFTETFPQAGNFSYYCSQHGTPTSGMTGNVVVQ